MTDEVELRTAWDAVTPANARSREVFDDVVSRHRQPHRRYHGLRHVVWVLRHVRALEAEIPECSAGDYDAAGVAAAAFFHDAIYDATRADNEERSAVLATNQLASLGWDDARIAVVAELVRATASHLADDVPAAAGRSGSRVSERRVLLDADLAVLGSDPAAYGTYATGVRVEHGHLSDETWATGRADVLRRLLARPALYATTPARAWWEARARANMTAELASLTRD